MKTTRKNKDTLCSIIITILLPPRSVHGHELKARSEAYKQAGIIGISVIVKPESLIAAAAGQLHFLVWL